MGSGYQTTRLVALRGGPRGALQKSKGQSGKAFEAWDPEQHLLTHIPSIEAKLKGVEEKRYLLMGSPAKYSGHSFQSATHGRW